MGKKIVTAQLHEDKKQLKNSELGFLGSSQIRLAQFWLRGEERKKKKKRTTMTKPRYALLLVLVMSAFAVYLVASGAVTASQGLKPVQDAPDLTGVWKGEWGGTHHGRDVSEPIGVIVDSQQAEKVSGTAILRSGKPIPMTGILGAKEDGSVWAALDVRDARTAVSFDLKVVSEKRLEGSGHSARHVGPVYLNRE